MCTSSKRKSPNELGIEENRRKMTIANCCDTHLPPANMSQFDLLKCRRGVLAVMVAVARLIVVGRKEEAHRKLQSLSNEFHFNSLYYIYFPPPDAPISFLPFVALLMWQINFISLNAMSRRGSGKVERRRCEKLWWREVAERR